MYIGPVSEDQDQDQFTVSHPRAKINLKYLNLSKIGSTNVKQTTIKCHASKLKDKQRTT